MRLPLAFVILASLTRWTTAEINAADTIEWVTADSTLVVVGTVERVVSRGSWREVTLRVGETLKGTSSSKLTFSFRVLAGDPAQKWEKKSTEILVFLVDAQRYVARDKDFGNEKLVPRFGPSSTGIYDLATTEAYTTDYKVLRKRDELLAAVRGASKSTATKAYRLDAPHDTDAHNTLYGGSTVWIYVPVDAALEVRAKTLLTSKSLWTRAEAIGALEHFKSPANIKLVQAMLADKEFAEVTETGKPTLRRYLARKRAHEVLTTWGVAHKKPVIEDRKP